MIHSIKFKKDYRCFKAEDEINFRPGINLLVGDQGTGKSTILQLIRNSGTKTYIREKAEIVSINADHCSFFAFDLEKDMPRNTTVFGNHIEAELALMWSSHGQAVKAMVKAIPVQNGGVIVILDEPDMALSVRSCVEIVGFLDSIKKKDCQILAAVHNPVFILSQKEVLSLEHRKWMSSKEFLSLHGFDV